MVDEIERRVADMNVQLLPKTETLVQRQVRVEERRTMRVGLNILSVRSQRRKRKALAADVS